MTRAADPLDIRKNLLAGKVVKRQNDLAIKVVESAYLQIFTPRINHISAELLLIRQGD